MIKSKEKPLLTRLGPKKNISITKTKYNFTTATNEELNARQEAMVLTDQSLGSLAKDLGASGLTFCMMLNIPNTRIVRAKIESSSLNLGEQLEYYDATKSLLMYWKYV